MGIEHFAKPIKTISYRAVAPKSCLKNCAIFGGLRRAQANNCESRERVVILTWQSQCVAIIRAVAPGGQACNGRNWLQGFASSVFMAKFADQLEHVFKM